MSKWDSRFLRLAHEIAGWSKDRSTRVGAVIVGKDKTPGPYGYNGFPRYVDDERSERHERPVKYKWTEHAERNAIYNAARMGVALKDCTIYVTHLPCADCTRAIVQVGISRIVVDAASLKNEGFAKRWGEDEKITRQMLKEGRVKLDFAPLLPENKKATPRKPKPAKGKAASRGKRPSTKRSKKKRR